MRTWLEMAPFAEYAHLQFVIASRSLPDQEPLRIHAPNVKEVSQETTTKEAFIDYLYGLHGDLLVFPLASREYIRESPAKVVGVDYGMENLYCRNYIAPRSVTEMMQGHEFAMKNYTGIITVSKTSQRDLAWFFPEYKDKVQVIYPGNRTIGMPAKQELPESLQAMSYFLIVGYEHKKNIIRITDAFDRFKVKTGSPSKLALAGNPGFGAHEIDEHIRGLASVQDIVRLGYVPDAQKRLLMQHCRALVALPIYEGFGISALEGLEAGRVVLVSDNGSLQEIVGNAGYTADPFSVDSIEKQLTFIDTLDENPKKQYIKDRLALFDQSVQSRNLLEFLNTITVT